MTEPGQDIVSQVKVFLLAIQRVFAKRLAERKALQSHPPEEILESPLTLDPPHPEERPERKRKQFVLALVLLALLMLFFAFRAFAPKEFLLAELRPILVAAALGAGLGALFQWFTIRKARPDKRKDIFLYLWPAVVAFFAILYAGMAVQRGTWPNWEYAFYSIVLLLALIGLMDSIWNVRHKD